MCVQCTSIDNLYAVERNAENSRDKLKESTKRMNYELIWNKLFPIRNLLLPLHVLYVSLSLCFSPIFVGPTLHGNYGVILHTQILLLDNTLYASLCIAHAKDAHKMHMCVLCAHQICEVQAVNILVPMAQVSRNICMKWTYAPANTEPNRTNIRNVKPIEHIGKEAKETRWEMKHDANAHIAHCLPKFRLIGV